MKTVIGSAQRKATAAEKYGGDGVPSSAELLNSLVVGANIIDYLTKHVRVLGGTFENGTAVFIRKRAAVE